jgi:hypothetical protein
MRLVWGSVQRVEQESEAVQRLIVTPDVGESGPALSYPALAGWCAEGDRVLLNTTAVDLGLGTGGLHYVVCRAGVGEGIALDRPSGGHLMKLRYTPLQLDIVSVEAPESPHHSTMEGAETIGGMPVVCCGLHSQIPLVAAAVKRAEPTARVVWCMTDQAALPLALSEVARAALEAGLLDATVSCGQAFGGSLEAVNLHSGLLAAHHVLDADVAIVAIGPGVAGTATPFGHGGVAQGEAINAVATLQGTPIACLRLSFADLRPRHRPVSHHTLVALTRVALAPAIVAIPTLDERMSDAIHAALEKARVADRHRLVTSAEGSIAPPPLRGLEVTTMGRGPSDDPAFFAAAYAAGDIAFKVARSPFG